MLSDGRLGAEQEEAVQEQLTEINRMQHIIEDLLFLSRAEAQAIKPGSCGAIRVSFSMN